MNRFPNTEQAALLTAVVDTLVPADENGPSGSAAGVNTYIISMLAANEPMRELYEANLAALDEYSSRTAGLGFAAIDSPEQAAILRTLEAGSAEGTFEPDSSTFFAMLYDNMLEKLFGDPKHGGNVDFAGWKLIGYRGVKLIQTEADQEIDGAPERPLMARREAIESALAELSRETADAGVAESR